MSSDRVVGAVYLGEGRCRFCVWAPLRETVYVRILDPEDRLIRLEKDGRGYHSGIGESVEPGFLYLYRLDGDTERPDPASRLQPRGVHGPSQVVDSRFPWKDRNWRGTLLEDYIIYELHVGTFTEMGTFDAVWTHLNDIEELGVTAIELMPVAQFPGERNWGYDGAYPFAVQASYGGLDGLKRLVDECHRRGLAVILDVVYNHLGPEGNYLWDFGPYFTDRYKTPWGSAVNFDGPYSNGVRDFFVANAVYWVTELHVDALRLDAVHGIFDFSAVHILQEVGEAVHRQGELLGRHIYVIPESDLNNSRLIRSKEVGGYGLDAQWNDDFHHALHTLLTGEKTGYYQDFGKVDHFTKALREGYVYSGQYSEYRKRSHGNSSGGIAGNKFIVFAQNHDQVGNRAQSERLCELVSYEALKLAASAVMLSPFIPLLFMGEEYGEPARFPYFVSHSDAGLIEAVRKGRKDEFSAFGWSAEPPDPQAESTFRSAKPSHALRRKGKHGVLYEFHKTLIALRKQIRTSAAEAPKPEVSSLEKYLLCLMTYEKGSEQIAVIMYFGSNEASVTLFLPPGLWIKQLSSAEEKWGGPGSTVASELVSDGEISLQLTPYCVVVLSRNGEE